MTKKSKSKPRRNTSETPIQLENTNQSDAENATPHEKEDYTENSILPDKIHGAEETNSADFTPKSNNIMTTNGDAAANDNQNQQEDTSYSFPMVHMKKPNAFNTIESAN